MNKEIVSKAGNIIEENIGMGTYCVLSLHERGVNYEISLSTISKR